VAVAIIVGSPGTAGAVDSNLIADGDWGDPNIWSTPAVPGASDKARPGGGFTVDFTAASGDQTIGQMWAHTATINISGDKTLKFTGTANLAWAGRTVINQSGATFQASTLNVLTTSHSAQTVDYTQSGGQLVVDNNMHFGTMCCGASIREANYTISGTSSLTVGSELAFATGTYGGSLNWSKNVFTVVGSTPTINVGNGLRINDQSAIPGFTTIAFEPDAAGVSPINVTGPVTLNEGLDVNLAAYTADAAEIVLIANDLADPMAGSFASVAVAPAASGRTYAISYAGGDGNDLSLVGKLTWDATANDWGTAHWSDGTAGPLLVPTDGLGMAVTGGTSTVSGAHSPYSLDIGGGTVSIGAAGDLTVARLGVSAAAGLNGVAGGKLTVTDTMSVDANIDLSNVTVDTSAATVNLAAGLTHNAGLTAATVNVNSGGSLALGGGDLTVTGKLGVNANLDMSAAGLGALNATGAEISVAGSNTLTIDNAVTPAVLSLTDGGAVTLGAGGSMAATSQYFLRNVSTALDLGGAAELLANDDSGSTSQLVELTGTASYTGKTQINRAVLRVGNPGPGDNLNIGTGNLEFSSNNDGQPAILETSGTIARQIGTGDGQIYWGDRGGFAAYGADLTVTLTRGDSAALPLDWSSGTDGFRGRNLHFGSPTATNTVDLTNDIELDGNRTIYTFDNPGLATDIAVLSGDISETGGVRNLTKRGKGILWLAGEVVSYTGVTTIQDGNDSLTSVLRAVDPAAASYNLSPSSRIKFNLATLETCGDLWFDIGTGAGNVEFANHGGFSAWGPAGEDLTVTLNGGATVMWRDATAAGGLNSKRLYMTSPNSNAAVFLTNDIDGGAGGDHHIYVQNNPNSDADRTVFQGNLSNIANLRIHSKSENANYPFEHGICEFAGSVTTSGYVQAEHHGQIRVTGTVNAGTEVRINGNSKLSGSGTINAGNRTYVNNGCVIAPGASIGTLTIGSGELELRAGSVYEFELGAPSAPGVQDGNDLIDVAGDLDLQGAWKLALFDLGGLVANDTDKIPLFTYGGNLISLGAADVDPTALDTEVWTIGALTVADDGAGMVYLTGLSGGTSAAIPGDANSSGFVDDDDLAVLLSNWEQDAGTITDWALGDFTGDTDVDDDDLAVLLGNWTGPAPGGAAVPEPATLALLGLGGLSVLRRRRK